MKTKKIAIVLISLVILSTFVFGQNEFHLNVVSVTPKVQIFENSVISPLFNMSLSLENQNGTNYLDIDIKSVASQPMTIKWNMTKIVVNDRVYSADYLEELPSILNPSEEISAKIKLAETFLTSSEFKLILPVTYNNDTLSYKITLKTFVRPTPKIFKPKTKNSRNVYVGLEAMGNTNGMEIGGRMNLPWLSIGFDHALQTNVNTAYAFVDLYTHGNIQWYAGVGGQTVMGNWKNLSALANAGVSAELFSDMARLYLEVDYNISKSNPYLSGGIQYGF